MATYGKDEVKAAVRIMTAQGGTLTCGGGVAKSGEPIKTAGKVYAGVVGAASHLAWCSTDRATAGLPPRATAGSASLAEQAKAAIAALDA